MKKTAPKTSKPASGGKRRNRDKCEPEVRRIAPRVYRVQRHAKKRSER